MALVIGFGGNGEFRNDIADQADESYTVTAGPGEVVHLTDDQITVVQDDENR
ncbi:hypothetical protein ACFVT2_01060 [Streptomyces sp. NPDC058000]|uniref:hypothetical protein n=1 Tax=Streptomyces sp. NPDC058000 TaxID=3346299 RepID=UPI0036EFDB9B